MHKFVFILLIILVILGITINAITDWQVTQGIPLTNDYLNATDCLQDIIVIMITTIGGLVLLLAPNLIVSWLTKIAPRSAKGLNVRLFGMFILVTVPFSVYSYAIVHQCNVLQMLRVLLRLK